MSQLQRLLISALVVLALAVTVPAFAQTGGYAIESFTVAGGGGTSSGGGFTLTSAIGQPEAGTLAGGAFKLTGGFLAAAVVAGGPVYLPLVHR